MIESEQRLIHELNNFRIMLVPKGPSGPKYEALHAFCSSLPLNPLISLSRISTCSCIHTTVTGVTKRTQSEVLVKLERMMELTPHQRLTLNVMKTFLCAVHEVQEDIADGSLVPRVRHSYFDTILKAFAVQYFHQCTLRLASRLHNSQVSR